MSVRERQGEREREGEREEVGNCENEFLNEIRPLKIFVTFCFYLNFFHHSSLSVPAAEAGLEPLALR